MPDARPAAGLRRCRPARWPPATATPRWATPRLRAGDAAGQRAPRAHGDGRHADRRPRRLRDARQRRFLPAPCWRSGEDFERISDYVGWTIHAAKAMGVKVVNPGGISAFKFNQRKLDVDEKHVHYGVTPRDIMLTLARAAARARRAASAAHPRQQSRRGRQHRHRRWRPSPRSKACRSHLTHVQFHSYGTEGTEKFSRRARDRRGGERAPNISIDVGQIMFGQTVTASGDTHAPVRQPKSRPSRASGSVGDIECDAGCGVVPFRYRDKSYVNALQWAIGLEIFLLVDDPWRDLPDHRPPERRPVHELSAPDPAADGQELPRRAAAEAPSRRRQVHRRCRHSTASTRSTKSRS